MKTNSFRDLIVWQKSYQLALEVYKITEAFPQHEKFGMSQQMRRTAVSIPSNIAEGYGRKHRKEYDHVLSMAYGSQCELDTQYHLCKDSGYAKHNDQVLYLLNEVGKMLYRLLHPKR